MGNIKVLDDATINQIAAGEVVERPASVVKELVENAIDAGATRISISLRDGGKSFIQIRDNGCGMSRDDALLSFHKHATSKIRDIEDIFTIASLGFRGEALSSIASVSQATLVTRTAPGTLDADQLEGGLTGTRIVIEGGEVKRTEEIGCPAGTTITVENLFFNVPARLKYLKTDRTELNHVLSVVTERALAYPGTFFELTHEGRRLILSPGSGDLLETVASIMGKTAARSMVELNFGSHRARISGFISRPSHTRANQKHIHLFINRRPVRSPAIIRAIRDGFGTLLPPVRYPVGVIMITLDPAEVDVNIHPAKTAVKFQHPDDVASAVSRAVEHALRGKDLSVEASPEGPGRKRGGGKGKDAASSEPHLRKGLFTDAEKRRMKVAEARERYGADQGIDGSVGHGPSTRLIRERQALIDEPGDGTIPGRDLKERAAAVADARSPVPVMRPIGQVGNLFIVVETEEGLAIIDQHAAHERVRYEELKRGHREEPVTHQRLIEPISLELAPEERQAVETYRDILLYLGFEIEEFGGNTYMVRTVPVILGKHTTPRTIYDIIDELVATGKVKGPDEQKDAMLKLLACHSAIRGGEELTMVRIEKLLEELLPLENPFTCPHGRPTIIRMSTKELEKKFKRTGF